MKIVIKPEELDKVALRLDLCDAAFDLAYREYESIGFSKKMAILLLRIEKLEIELADAKKHHNDVWGYYA